MKKFLVLFQMLVALTGLSSAGLSHAINVADQVKIQTALMTGDFAYLENRFNKAQKAFELDTRNSVEIEGLYGALYSLYNTTKWHRVLYRTEHWVRNYPESYAALTARGKARVVMGFFARGSEFVPDTSQNRFSDMRRWHGMAKEDLLASLKLTRYPLISHIELHNIAMAGSDDESKYKHFAEAYLIAPASMRLHLNVMNSLRPRWGGSYAAMMAYIDKVKGHVKSERDLNRLKAMIPSDMASTQDSLKNTQLAYEMHETALELSKTSSYLCTRAYYAEVLEKPKESILRDLLAAARVESVSHDCMGMVTDYARKNFKAREAITLLDAYLKHLPYSYELLNAKASVYIERGNIAAAMPVLMKSAELKDDWAQTLAGKHLVNGWGVRRDTEKGLNLLRAAADNDYRDAQASLVLALESLGRTKEAEQARKRYTPQDSTPSYTYR